MPPETEMIIMVHPKFVKWSLSLVIQHGSGHFLATIHHKNRGFSHGGSSSKSPIGLKKIPIGW